MGGLVPSNRAFVEIRIKQVCKGKGYEIIQITNNPGVPLGKNFEIHMKYTLKATDLKTCSVKITANIVFKHKTIFKGFIVDAGTKEIINLYNDRWFPALTKYIAANPQQETELRKASKTVVKESSQSIGKSIPLGSNFTKVESRKKNTVISQDILVNLKSFSHLRDLSILSSPWLWCVIFFMILYWQVTAVLDNNFDNMQNAVLNRSLISV